MNFKTIFVVATILAANGCATLDKSECENADWQIIGLEDGAEGKTPSYIGEHRSACAQHDITPDYSAYKTGYDAGLKQYCTATNGFLIGEEGNEYKGVCPPELEQPFIRGYNHGHEIYNVKSDIRSVEYSISSSHEKIRKLKKKIREREKELIADETSKEHRSDLLDEIKHLQYKIEDLHHDIHEYKTELVTMELYYEQLLKTVY